MTNDFDLANTRKQLDTLRRKHGASSAIGSRCSILMGQLDNLPPGPEDRIDYLTPDWVFNYRTSLLEHISKTKGDLARLLAVNAEE